MIIVSVHAGSRVGGYEIISPIGAGGMGEVYRAHDPRLRRDVAIKFLSDQSSLDPTLVSRFQIEAQATSALNHPRSVPGAWWLVARTKHQFLRTKNEAHEHY